MARPNLLQEDASMNNEKRPTAKYLIRTFVDERIASSTPFTLEEIHGVLVENFPECGYCLSSVNMGSSINS